MLLLVISLIFFGFSVSQVLTPIAGFIMGSVAAQKRGIAAGIYNTMRFTGATMGMAFLGTIYSAASQKGLESYIESHFDKITKDQKEELKLIFTGIKDSSSFGLNVQEIKNQARISAYQGIKNLSLFSLVLLIIGFSLIFLEKQKNTTS